MALKKQQYYLSFLVVIVAVLLVAYVSVRMFNAGSFSPSVQKRVLTQAEIDAARKDLETSPDIKFYDAGESKIAEVKGTLASEIVDNGLVYVSRVKPFNSSYPDLNIIVGAKRGVVLFGIEKPAEVNYSLTPVDQVSNSIKVGDIVTFKIVLPRDPSTSRQDPGYIAQQTAFYNALKEFEQNKQLQDPQMHFVVDQLGVYQL